MRSLIPLKRVESIVRPLHCRSQPVNLIHRSLEHHRLPRESAAEHGNFFGEIKLVSHRDPEKARLLVFASQPGKSKEEDAKDWHHTRRQRPAYEC